MVLVRAADAGSLVQTMSEVGAITHRNLIRIRRIPQAIVYTLLQPVMFVLLFRYVFGGAIVTPGHRYVDYLIPGVLVQSVLFIGVGTAVAIADDQAKGLAERFQSLPISRAAVLAGRAVADLARNVLLIAVMVAVGYAVGFRPHASIAAMVAALVVVAYFAFSVTWIFMTVGRRAGEPEAAQMLGFLVVFPLTFASSAFVPTAVMPDWLEVVARNQPVTVAMDAVRALVLGGPRGPVVASLLWTSGLLAVFVPLAIAGRRERS